MKWVLRIERGMKWVLPNPITGALAGFILAFLASGNLALLGVDVAGWPAIECAMLGAILGCFIGLHLDLPPGRPRTVARWCAYTALAVGVVAFLIGFVGPILLTPDLPQGPLLGIFCTGPLGALAGAILGAVIGLFVTRGFGAR